MAKINKNFQKLSRSYLFLEIAKRTKEFTQKHPDVEVLRLGIGNTTEPLPLTVIEGLKQGVAKLADVKTYTGYGDEQGGIRVRSALVNFYSKRGILLDTSEVFISDGAKPDTANIQSIFDPKSSIAIQDPVYPVYLDTSIINGKKIVYMECTKDNGFVPSVPKKKVDIIYLCTPNNPTGAVMNKKQLKAFVDYATRHKAIIVFDAAYFAFIKDPRLPRSIYEIPGAKSCAIEINSFSKIAGFTGVRLGWTIVPNDLAIENTKKGNVRSLWLRRQATMFNGASNIAQEGGLAVLSNQGWKESMQIVAYYMQNAKIIKDALEKLGLTVYGGENAPYIWLRVPKGMTSWQFFDKLLRETHVVVTPGSGFGPAGEGYVRLSAFGHQEDIKKAVAGIKQNLKL